MHPMIQRRGVAAFGCLALSILATSRGVENLRAAETPPVEIDVAALERSARAGDPLVVRLPDRTLRLSVKATQLRATDYRVFERRPERLKIKRATKARLYEGVVIDEPDSHVRLAFTRRGLRGTVKVGRELTFIEPALTRTAPGDRRSAVRPHRVSTLDKIAATTGPIDLCAGGGHERGRPHAAEVQVEEQEIDLEGLESPDLEGLESPDLEGLESPDLEGLESPTSEDVQVLRMAVEVDAILASRLGDEAAEYAESVFHQVSAIFERELGVRLELSAVVVRPSAAVSYSNSDPSGLLAEFRNSWNDSRSGLDRSSAFLLTGVELEGTAGGIAYVSTICDERWAYGLAQGFRSTGLTAMVVAHELGHTLGAMHDSSDSSYLMAPGLDLTTQPEFSEASKRSMNQRLRRASCLALEAEPTHDGFARGTFLRGDGNGNGAIELGDVSSILDQLFSSARTIDCADALDSNDDGQLELTDALHVALYLLSGSRPPAAPYPIAGSDQTADALPACTR